MTQWRARLKMVLLILLLSTPRLVSAQGASDRTAVAVATLIDAEAKIRSRPNGFAPTRVLFDPTMVRGWWENGIHRDSVGAPRIRDSAETATLAAALRAVIATPEMIRECGGPPTKPSCSLIGIRDVVYAIADARISGDSATVLLRSGPTYYLGSTRPNGGRAGSIGLVRLMREDGHWMVLCSVVAGTDFVPPASSVEAQCAAAMRGRGG